MTQNPFSTSSSSRVVSVALNTKKVCFNFIRKRILLIVVGIFFSLILNAQSSKSVNLTAGSLIYALTTSELQTIANLIITGTIDARDFKTMRDKMPLLEALDLGGVNIAAYTGSDGTTIWNNTTYPANTIPETAFMNGSYKGKIGLTSIVLPSSMTSFGQYSFGHCDGITAITIPPLVTNLGNNTFEGCTGLKSVIIPSSVTNTGNSTFIACKSLTAVSIPSSVITIGYGTFAACPGLTSITIPSSVTNIGGSAFAGCTGLTSINIPFSVVSMGSRAFEGSGLKSINIPPLVTSIERYVFSKCNGLTSITIPSWITFIDEAAFYECKNLSTVSILSPSTSLGNWAFGNCTSLASLTVPWTIPPSLQDYTISAVDRNSCILHVPFGTAIRYAAHDHWKWFTHIVEPDNGFSLSTYTSKVASAAGSTSTIEVTANVNWTASSDKSWLTVSPSNGNSNQTLTFTADVNPSSTVRTTKVTVSSAGFESQIVTINQNGSTLTLNLSPGGLASALTSQELNTITHLTLTGTIDARDFKTIRDKMNMLSELNIREVTIAKYKGPDGTQGAYFNDEYPANTIPNGAFGSNNVRWQLSSLTLPKSLTYIGNAFAIEISSMTIDIPVPIDLSQTSNPFGGLPWRCILHVPYGTASLYKSAEKWKEFSQVVEASQGFFVSSHGLTLAGEEGSKSTVDIKANVNWAVSSDQDWLMVSPLSGEGNQTITFTAKANPLFTKRTAIVTVSGSGVSSQTITVTQTFQIQPLKTLEVTAGNLSTALSSDELNTISKLTLTGTIDARDFKTMRDKMPVLEELDLSGATIVGYTGTEGTSTVGNQVYLANVFPQTAFISVRNGDHFGKTSLKSVIFPSALTSISESALTYCNNITNIVLPPSVKSIESFAFGYCTSLTSLNIPSSVTSIGSHAFTDCTNLTSVTTGWTIPLVVSSSIYIFTNFNTCTLNVPFGTASRYTAANLWKNFTHIVEMPGFFLPATTAMIESVEGSKSVVDINSDVTWTAISDQNWLSISPSSGTGIGQKLTFTANGNSSITQRTAKITVSAIGIESQTISVTQVGAPLNITPGSLATTLTTAELSSLTNLTLTGTIDARDFKTIRDKMPLFTMLDISGATIAEYNGKEGTNQYTYQNTLYPANTIPENAFYNLNKISSIILPPSLTSIGKYAFAHCSLLTNIDIPTSVTSIGDGAFSYCVGMIAMTIPSSVTTIGSFAFQNCNKLTSIREKSSIPPGSGLSYSVFNSVDKIKCTLYVPYGTASRYRTANQWRDFKNIVEDSEGFNVSSYMENLSYTSGSNATVTINSNINWTASSDQTWLSTSPASGTGIAQKLIFTAEANPLSIARTAYVTISASGVESQTITITQAMKPQPPKTLEITAGDLHSVLTPHEFSTITDLSLTGTIDARDFKIMRDNMPLLARLDLSRVTIVAYNGPDGTSTTGNKDYPKNTIPECAFYSNNWNVHSSLTTIVFPESLTAFGQYAFHSCGGLNKVTLPLSVTDIGSAAFFNCSGLTTINITSKVTSIGIQAFGAFNGLITVDQDNLNFSAIEGVLFNKTKTELIQCPISKSGKYTIPSTVLSIGNSAFADCSKLTGALIIPSTVLTIGSYAFYNCSGFNGKLSIPSSVVLIEGRAFLDCYGITTLSIPLSVTTIQGGAFMNCYGLSSIYAYSASPINLEKKFVFTNVNKTTCTLYVPYGSKSLYQMADEWKDFTNIVELNSGTIANAGPDQVINEGQVVTLDGTSSKSNNNNNPLSYKWTAPVGITLSSETPSNPIFIAPEVTTETSFTFSLIIYDGAFGSEADEVTIIVKQLNKAPIANAGTNQSVNENSLVTLDGSASIDADQDQLSYLWTAPAGITLSSETAKNPTFTAPEVSQDNIYRFILLVNDGKTDLDTSQVSIIVKQVLPVLKLVSKTSDSQISSTEVVYQIYIKKGNSFYKESVTPVMNGDTTKFSLEPGEWIVLASPTQNSPTFVPTYSGNTLEWINAEHIIIPEKGITFKEITCVVPEVANNGTGQISGYVYEKPDTGTKSIFMTNNPAGSGNPVPGALIRLFKKGNTVPILSIFTDAQGFYKFDQLEISEYQIEVEIPGFTQSEKFGIAISVDQPVATAYFGVNTSSQVITDDNPQLLSSLKIYPNPVVRLVTVEVGRSNTIPYSILVYSIDGELMINQVATSTKTLLDFSRLLAGSYLIEVCSGTERQSSIVIKK